MSKVKISLTEINNLCEFSYADKNINTQKINEFQDRTCKKLISLIETAVKNGAEAVFLNELCNAPYFAVSHDFNRQWLHFAINIENSVFLNQVKEISSKLHILVVAPIYEVDSEGKYYNTAVVIDAGETLGLSRKTNVPFGQNEKGVFAEGYYYSANAENLMNFGKTKVIDTYSPLFPVFETSIGKVGVNICYGRHFPENWKILAKNGAEIVFCPAVTFGDVSERIWKNEFQVSAVWNNIFTLASNRVGREFIDANSPDFYGKSCAFDPCGNEVRGSELTLSQNNKNMIFELNKDLLLKNQSGWNLKADQREEAVKGIMNNDVNQYLPTKTKQIIYSSNSSINTIIH